MENELQYSTSDEPMKLTYDSTSDEPMKLTYDMIKQITDDFAEERIIGSGTFGKVYRVR
jgi:hypothetical protein